MGVPQAEFRRLALSLANAVEVPHFEISSFRFNKKIFATLWEKENRAMLKLTEVDQSVFCSNDKSVFYPVPNAWGKKGATLVDLSKVRKDILTDALQLAYNDVINNKKVNK